MWIGAQDGLNIFDVMTGRFTTYSQREGLPGNVVGCVLEDGHGDLWMSTDNGVARFDPQGKTFRSYSTADGLPGPDSFRLPLRNSLGYAGLVLQARGRRFRQSFELRRKIVLRNHNLDEQRAGGVAFQLIEQEPQLAGGGDALALRAERLGERHVVPCGQLVVRREFAAGLERIEVHRFPENDASGFFSFSACGRRVDTVSVVIIARMLRDQTSHAPAVLIAISRKGAKHCAHQSNACDRRILRLSESRETGHPPR